MRRSSPLTPPSPPGSGSRLPSIPTKYAIQMTVNGGAEPNAWNIAHNTAMSKPHHAIASTEGRVSG